jgi:hypothetical protein
MTSAGDHDSEEAHRSSPLMVEEQIDNRGCTKGKSHWEKSIKDSRNEELCISFGEGAAKDGNKAEASCGQPYWPASISMR